MTKKAVILLSGGLDSTTCLAIAKQAGFDCHTLSVYYGQKHVSELNAAKRIAHHFQVPNQFVTITMGKWGGSALTDPVIAVPSAHTHQDAIPVTYVPARNTIFLSLALGLAEILDANSIFIGANAIDYSGYPDCRPDYFNAFQNMANLATKAGVNGKVIQIETPLLTFTKAEIIQLGTSLGIDYHITISCYRATEEGLACGTCDSCVLRQKGFQDASMEDATRYV